MIGFVLQGESVMLSCYLKKMLTYEDQLESLAVTSVKNLGFQAEIVVNCSK